KIGIVRSCGIQGITAQILTGYRPRLKQRNGGVEAHGTGDVLLSGPSPTQSQFQVVHKVSIVHKAFLVYFPGEGRGREIPPAIVLREKGGGIHPEGNGEQIPVEQVQVSPTEIRLEVEFVEIA